MNFSSIIGLSGLQNGVAHHALKQFQNNTGLILPLDLSDFLEFSDGCLLETGVKIYSLDELQERNETYEITEYAPGYILIGDDSGGKGFLLSLQKETSEIYSSGLGDMSPNGFKVIANSFQSWIDRKLTAP